MVQRIERLLIVIVRNFSKVEYRPFYVTYNLSHSKQQQYFHDSLHSCILRINAVAKTNLCMNMPHS